MTSPFSILFLAIQARLDAIVDTESKPVFLTNDQDFGQLEDYTRGNRPNVNFPCALIDIDDSEYTNMGRNTQQAVVNIGLRIGFAPYSATEMKVPGMYKNRALYYYDLEDMVVKAFHGWSPGIVQVTDTETADLSNIFGHFIRTRIAKEDRDDLVRVRKIFFTLSMDDFAVKRQISRVPATLNILTEID